MVEQEESLLGRLRAAVMRGNQPQPATTSLSGGLEPGPQLRDSVRLLARQRVSQALHQLRAGCGLTYEQVQERTGLSQQLLYDFEYRDRRLTIDDLRALATCYGSSVNDILGVDLDL
jgi:hypothetical protein